MMQDEKKKNKELQLKPDVIWINILRGAERQDWGKNSGEMWDIEKAQYINTGLHNY